jgi:hypothetical protein
VLVDFFDKQALIDATVDGLANPQNYMQMRERARKHIIDKYDLKPESDVELKTVLQLLTANPTMKIEISGHTDNTG